MRHSTRTATSTRAHLATVLVLVASLASSAPASAWRWYLPRPAEVEEACQLVLKIREQGVSIILVEHHMKAIMRISDRVIVLHHGEKIGDAPPAEIVQNREVVKAYLGEGAAHA